MTTATTHLDVRIGAPVLCEGEECGHVSKLVVDPHTHSVTDVIVEKGLLFGEDTVVPMDMVEEPNGSALRLTISKDDLDTLPEYIERSYVAPPETWDSADAPRQVVLHRLTPIHSYYPTPMVPMVVHHIREGVPSERAVIERGVDVFGEEGKIGTIDHVIVDAEDGEMKALVVDRGLLRENVVVPAELVSLVSEDHVRVLLDEDGIADLYHYAPRSEIDIMAEVKDRLSRIPVEPDAIEADLSAGILTLSGVVPNVRIKRRVEAACRAVEGVLDVDNRLHTARSIEASVMTALRADPRTDLAGIDIVALQGKVTLTGQVDSEEIKDAATEIAREQEGVTQVINDLTVGHDDESPLLRAAWFGRGVLYGTGTGSTIKPN